MTAIPGQFDDCEDAVSDPTKAVVDGQSKASMKVVPVVSEQAEEEVKIGLSTEHNEVRDEATQVVDAIKNSLNAVTSQFEDAANAVTDHEEYNDEDDDSDFEDEDDAYYGYDDQDGPANNNTATTTTTSSAAALSKRMNLSHSVKNAVTKMQHLENTKRTLTTDRNDRATTEQCLDPRTRLILFKLISRGFLEQIDGCLSTGKEANVYYAKAGKAGISTIADASSSSGDNIAEFAIKIYKTSILVFKDRDKYVAGEHRWRKGYCKSNPRKMVKVWAEKEMRNYRRIYAAGIPCPAPILLKSHVLIMEFLGNNGWPSPRLKDTNLKEKRLREAYVQTIFIMRHMFQRCKLVHGDLSEYNLLWHNSEIYVIDVSQSVESDHPSALDFLRKDASNVNDYFAKTGGLHVMTTRQLFEFIIAPLVPADKLTDREAVDAFEMARLDEIMNEVDRNAKQQSKSSEQERRAYNQQEAVNEAVFMSSFLPRSLNQVADYDVHKLEKGDVEDTYANAVASLTGNQNVVDAITAKKTQSQQGEVVSVEEGGKSGADNSHVPKEEATALTAEGEEEDESDDDSYDESDDDDDDGSERYQKVPRTAEELHAEKEAKKEERKANKKAVREAQSEKRRTKIKKKDKKRAIKKAKAGNRKNK
ncbi:protein kinase RIO1 [Seminavis robusta]|uniref:Serine/threonine-protein kinase RIO1 n=1 Tax=Seminavis robusta TaxID=568900 RepID=A0A9N8ELG4_9STRA|nr:protein kinase RIO1 [Seminavis robusta]|eukprot:Sro1412_g270480.1 protein kinase RIO1 (646) ;mRNA; r:17164-19190